MPFIFAVKTLHQQQQQQQIYSSIFGYGRIL